MGFSYCFIALIFWCLCRWSGKTWTMCKPQSSALTGDVSVTLPPPPSESLLKTWPLRYKHVGAHLNKHCLLVVTLILVALSVMVLLLLWNYQCFMVTKVCQEEGRGWIWVLKDNGAFFYIEELERRTESFRDGKIKRFTFSRNVPTLPSVSACYLYNAYNVWSLCATVFLFSVHMLLSISLPIITDHPKAMS